VELYHRTIPLAWQAVLMRPLNRSVFLDASLHPHSLLCRRNTCLFGLQYEEGKHATPYWHIQLQHQVVSFYPFMKGSTVSSKNNISY
jgi:hypothetical protein